MNNLHITPHISNLVEAAGFIETFGGEKLGDEKRELLHKRLIELAKEFTDLV